jgi:hypothetical protein
MLIDAALELLDMVDGGAAQRDWDTERKVQEAQIRLALIDLDATLANAEAAPTGRERLRSVIQGRFTIDMIREMLAEKRLAWRKEWSFYRPRIDEEFEDADLPG